jgi:hypothetical protein
MTKRRIRNVGVGLAAVLVGTSLFSASDVALAQGGGPELVSATFTSEFPRGFRIQAEVRGPSELEIIAVRIRIGQQTAGTYDYLDFKAGNLINGNLFWRTNTLGRYIPPGTIITYSFEIKDVDGNILKTEPDQFIYYDPAFEWAEITKGPVTVAYHGPVETRAHIVLDAMVETLGTMGPLLGADTDTPIRVTMYNNRLEMVRAQPPRSAAIARTTTTLGQAFSEEGMLLVMGSRDARGTASHEVTHILVHRAADSPGHNVPAWLNEGLAEYGNIEEGPEFDIALEFAVATGGLQSTLKMIAPPGNPEDLIIFYGQSRSIVRFMIERFGAEKMTELMAVMKRGIKTEDAIERVYGMSQLDLENMWRDDIGAPLYFVSDEGQARPTAIPRRRIGLYSLTPQPDTETVAAANDTPTAPPERTVSQPSDTPTPAPLAEEGERSGRGSGCSAALHDGPLDVTAAALLLGLVGLRFRPRRD